MFILTYILTFIIGGVLALLFTDTNKSSIDDNAENADQIVVLKQRLSEELQTKNKLIKSNNRLKKTIFKLKDMYRSKSTKEIDVNTEIIDEQITITTYQ